MIIPLNKIRALPKFTFTDLHQTSAICKRFQVDNITPIEANMDYDISQEITPLT